MITDTDTDTDTDADNPVCDICQENEPMYVIGQEGMIWAFRVCGSEACIEEANERIDAAQEEGNN